MVSGNAKLLKAYHNKKAGLFKKVRELGTLCDVKLCVIAYGPNSTVPETWPPDPSAVVQLIREYKKADKEEVRSSKKKKKKIPAPSDKCLDGCSPELLRQMMVELDERIGEATSWMQILNGGGEETLSHVPMNPQPMPVHDVPMNPQPMPVSYVPMNPQPMPVHDVPMNPQPMPVSYVPMNPQPMPVSYVPAAAPTPPMSGWFPLLDQNQVMYADGGSCYYANGNSSNSLGFASQGFFNMQCEWLQANVEITQPTSEWFPDLDQNQSEWFPDLDQNQSEWFPVFDQNQSEWFPVLDQNQCEWQCQVPVPL